MLFVPFFSDMTPNTHHNIMFTHPAKLILTTGRLQGYLTCHELYTGIRTAQVTGPVLWALCAPCGVIESFIGMLVLIPVSV